MRANLWLGRRKHNVGGFYQPIKTDDSAERLMQYRRQRAWSMPPTIVVTGSKAPQERCRRRPQPKEGHHDQNPLSARPRSRRNGARPAVPALAEDVKVGILGDLTGPIESLAPPIVAGAQLAFDQVNAQGGILGGKLVSITGDSACDPSVAGPAADKLVNTDQVTAIVGAFCTGATIGAATAAGIPGNVVQISPSASAPALTTLEDKDLVYRTTPSDAFQGVKLADLLTQKGVKDVALTYVNNDYGKGPPTCSSTITAGGTVSANVAHEDGKADYRRARPAARAAREPRGARLCFGLGQDDHPAGDRRRRVHQLCRRRRHDRRRSAGWPAGRCRERQDHRDPRRRLCR